ncbi:MAG: hypothetical protein J0H68_02960 [Sphingobacteriia bacterium]|nr:hypothetical protein [Sphingobacteriia bacterium]
MTFEKILEKKGKVSVGVALLVSAYYTLNNVTANGVPLTTMFTSFFTALIGANLILSFVSNNMGPDQDKGFIGTFFKGLTSVPKNKNRIVNKTLPSIEGQEFELWRMVRLFIYSAAGLGAIAYIASNYKPENAGNIVNAFVPQGNGDFAGGDQRNQLQRDDFNRLR